MYTERADLCYRLWRAGWELWWVPQAVIVHHEAQSTPQVAERVYVELYRSKAQFFAKYGGQPRARWFEWMVRLAYWPRLLVAALGAPLSPRLADRARTYRRLLAELPGL